MGIRKKSVPEEKCRTAISRAYYSLYHITSSKVKKKHSLKLINKIKKNYSKKKINLVLLNRLDPKHLRSYNLHKMYQLVLGDLDPIIAKRFKDFRIKRNMADYDLHLNSDTIYSRIIVNEIEKLTAKISAL